MLDQTGVGREHDRVRLDGRDSLRRLADFRGLVRRLYLGYMVYRRSRQPYRRQPFGPRFERPV